MSEFHASMIELARRIDEKDAEIKQLRERYNRCDWNAIANDVALKAEIADLREQLTEAQALLKNIVTCQFTRFEYECAECYGKARQALSKSETPS